MEAAFNLFVTSWLFTRNQHGSTNGDLFVKIKNALSGRLCDGVLHCVYPFELSKKIVKSGQLGPHVDYDMVTFDLISKWSEQVEQSLVIFILVTEKHDKYRCDKVIEAFAIGGHLQVDDAFLVGEAHALAEILCDGVQSYPRHVKACDVTMQEFPFIGHICDDRHLAYML